MFKPLKYLFVFSIVFSSSYSCAVEDWEVDPFINGFPSPFFPIDSAIQTGVADTGRWKNYYQKTRHESEPYRTLSLACKYFQSEGKIPFKAVDLGAGSGRDTLFLLEQGWDVLALDAEQQSIDIILERGHLYNENLSVAVVSFSEMSLPDNLELVNASYSLPYCPPQDFPVCWKKIVDSLVGGGRFSGHFFGENCKGADRQELTLLSFQDLLNLFHDQFEIEYMQIEEGLIPNVHGTLKQWHVYHVVAKKQKMILVPN